MTTQNWMLKEIEIKFRDKSKIKITNPLSISKVDGFLRIEVNKEKEIVTFGFAIKNIDEFKTIKQRR